MIDISRPPLTHALWMELKLSVSKLQIASLKVKLNDDPHPDDLKGTATLEIP